LNIFAKYGLIVFVAVIGISGQILLKKGLESFRNVKFDSFLLKTPTIVFEPMILLALLCYAIGMLGYLFLLSRLELTSIYPICTSLIFGGITLFGWLVLGESLNWAKASGIVLLIIGIFLIDRFG